MKKYTDLITFIVTGDLVIPIALSITVIVLELFNVNTAYKNVTIFHASVLLISISWIVGRIIWWKKNNKI